eukprot:365408-Chlamydomonas_euryale.AAC.4
MAPLTALLERRLAGRYQVIGMGLRATLHRQHYMLRPDMPKLLGGVRNESHRAPRPSPHPVTPSTAASMWKVNMSAPAAAKSVTHCLGWLTIRWQSNTAAECLRRHLMMGAPMVRLGTKWPSCG